VSIDAVLSAELEHLIDAGDWARIRQSTFNLGAGFIVTRRFSPFYCLRRWFGGSSIPTLMDKIVHIRSRVSYRCSLKCKAKCNNHLVYLRVYDSLGQWRVFGTSCQSRFLSMEPPIQAKMKQTACMSEPQIPAKMKRSKDVDEMMNEDAKMNW
jgi:hypothetical protein